MLALCVPPDAKYQIQKENSARDEALLRGALVLLCSHLEGFFEDLISDLVTAYDVLAQQTCLIPEELRAWQVLSPAAKWDVKDPAKRWLLVQGCASHPLINANGSKSIGDMDPALHTSDFSNPGTGEIATLFKNVGIKDVWISFHAKEPDSVFKNSIDAVVNRRNQIAHGQADATLTLSDAQAYVERAERVAIIFDELVSEAICKALSISDCWTALELAQN